MKSKKYGRKQSERKKYETYALCTGEKELEESRGQIEKRARGAEYKSMKGKYS
jgi:hypothetical protein